MSTWLPHDTKQALRKGASLEPERCESRSLLLLRMPSSPDTQERAAAVRKTSLERALACGTPDSASHQSEWLRHVPESQTISFSLWTDQRLLLGLANGVWENGGIDLHRFFGTPIISGSALKGVALDASKKLIRAGRLTDSEMCDIFGDAGANDVVNSSRAGNISFLAAHPARRNCVVELDVGTVHYPNYYGSGGVDYDQENPNPSLFPAVAEGEEFRFHLICRNARLPENSSVPLLQAAKSCLEHALVHRGVGAKSASGAYGRFRLQKIREIPIDPANDLFAPETDVRRFPGSAAIPTVGGDLASFVAKWSGEALQPDFIKRFAEEVRKLPADQRLAAFDACVPVARRVPDDSLWRAFRSRKHGTDLLKELKLS